MNDMTIVDDHESTGLVPQAMQAQTVGGQALLAAALVDKRLSTARAFPRSVSRFLAGAHDLLSNDVDTARSAEYAKPIGGGVVTGPSVRLAELAAMCWGNLEVEVTSVEVGEKQVIVRASAWDLQNNYRQEAIAATSIVGKYGRYKDSMIETAVLATASKAKRNAILSVIPRAYITVLLEHAKAVVRGKEKTLEQLRKESLDFFARTHKVTAEQVCERFEVSGPADLTLDHIDTLRAIANAIRTNEAKAEDFFQPPAPNERLETMKTQTQAQAKGGRKKAAPTEATPTPAEVVPEPTREREPGEEG